MLETRMPRLENDRQVLLFPHEGYAEILAKNRSLLASECARSRSLPLSRYSTKMTMNPAVVHENGDQFYVAQREWVEGRELTSDEGDLLRAQLFQLHAEKRSRASTIAQRTEFFPLRVISRVTKNLEAYPELVHAIKHWPGWSRLIEAPLQWSPAWHGDATTDNAILVPGGRVVLIDHSPVDEGPLAYDYAKVRRCELVNMAGERVGEVTDVDRQDDVLAAVVAGMVGSHGPGPGRVLEELWRELTS